MHRTRTMRAGLYHGIEVERAGGGLGGDFDYARVVADVRSVVRLSPAATLLLRGVGGTNLTGRLPEQKQFTVGGVDGLRAHAFGAYRGDRLALAQAEYVLGLWRLTHAHFQGGLQVMAFVDGGRAWEAPGPGFDLGRQHLAFDGGFGLGTTDDDLRVYFARDLQDPSSDVMITLRLRRPF
jgi:hemolysin activation/secretion protein